MAACRDERVFVYRLSDFLVAGCLTMETVPVAGCRPLHGLLPSPPNQPVLLHLYRRNPSPGEATISLHPVVYSELFEPGVS